MQTELIRELNKILKAFPQFWNGEELHRSMVVDAISRKQPDIIKALVANEKVRSVYGTDIDGIFIFDFDKLCSLLKYKEYWANSFTKYRNKVGLTSEGKYLDNSSDVVLDFPFKDCILEGGMTKEDQGKDEVYYNEIIARDEIDRLFSPKALTNAKRYTKDGVDENIDHFNDNDNIVFKGNNLIALHSIKERYAGKIKLIYIDPPYNTETDSFKYNDKFTQSTWLTFMRNRLEVAKELLHDTGTIYIQLDSKEIHYLKVLCDLVFGKDNFLNEIIWAYKERESSTRNYNKKHDTILFYAKNKNSNYTFNYNEIREEYSEVTIKKFKYNDEQGRSYRLRGKDGTNDPKIESENTYRQYLDKNSGPLPRDWFFLPILNQAANERLFDTQKPEKLLQKFILASSNENDLILDFFGGSGTTAAVAHKLKRRFITVEQLNSQMALIIPRLSNVIIGDGAGISKDIDWQGGGSFVYAELMELNAYFVHEIQKAQSYDELEKLFSVMKTEAHLNYQVALDNVLSAEYKVDGVFRKVAFSELELHEQKQLLIEILDKNQLYVNASDMDDSDLNISESDKAFTRSFYGME